MAFGQFGGNEFLESQQPQNVALQSERRATLDQDGLAVAICDIVIGQSVNVLQGDGKTAITLKRINANRFVIEIATHVMYRSERLEDKEKS